MVSNNNVVLGHSFHVHVDALLWGNIIVFSCQDVFQTNIEIDNLFNILNND